MKLFVVLITLIFLSISIKCYGQTSCPPPNIGFEDGTFNNWQCDTGHIDKAGVLHLTPSPSIPNRQTMIDKNYPYPTDYYGGFPSLCPNGSGHSIQLGSGSEDQLSLAERISYTFTVPAGSAHYNLIYNYAIVLQDPGFTNKEKPRFTIKTYDVTDGTYINCATNNFYVVPNLLAWKVSPQGAYYQDWTTASINLSGYAGKQIRIEFTTNHATRPLGSPDNTPAGYAYIDVNENCASPITGNAYCTGQSSVTLTAPPGFYSYFWYNPADLTKELGHNSMLTISPAPPDQTKYALVTTSMGCFDTLYTVVSKIDAGFVFKVKDTVYTCPNTAVDLTSSVITAGSSSNLSYTYYNDSMTLSFLYYPKTVTTSGTYYIKALSLEGCSNILPVVVMVLDSKAVMVTDPQAVVFPATIDLSSTFTHLNGFNYNYYNNSAATEPVTDYRHVSKTGTYYVQAVNISTGCSVLVPIHVTVNPPPPPIIAAPNAFTPNNDGINDHFQVTIIGYDVFKSLRVFNRAGQLVFESKTADTYWDGNMSGKPVNVGVYYWVFEGIYAYDGSKVYKAGFITLIR